MRGAARSAAGILRSSTSPVAAGVALWGLFGCSAPLDCGLPRPTPLVGTPGGMLYGYGASHTVEDASCDPSTLVTSGPLLVDVGTPLSAFRTDEMRLRRLNDGQMLILDANQKPSLLLCDAPLLSIGTIGTPQEWGLQWGDESLSPVHAILGGEVLRSYSLGLTFDADPRQPLCQKPPCMTLTGTDIADNCELSRSGEAVFPVTATGGNLIVQAGDDVFTYPATQLSLGVCLEPLADPLPGKLPCVQQGAGMDPFGVSARIKCLRDSTCPPNSPPSSSYCTCLRGLRAAQLDALNLLALDPSLAGACSSGGTNNVLPADFGAALPLLSVSDQGVLQMGCSGAQSGDADACFAGSGVTLKTAPADVVDEEHLRDRHYEPTGVNVRLLISTALPGLLLSQTAYARLRGDAAAQQLLASPTTKQIQFPGYTKTDAWPVTLGAQGGGLVSALAVLSTERFLDPCGELARSRRQRSSLTSCAGDTPSCQRAACLVNLEEGAARPEQRCGYSGQNTPLACDDHFSPVASVVEMDGPLEAMVVPDDDDILQALNGDLHDGSAAIDGIMGVSVLSRLQVNIDGPGNRVIAHCRCQAGVGCRTYPRYTDSDADDCQFNSPNICLPSQTPACG